MYIYIYVCVCVYIDTSAHRGSILFLAACITDMTLRRVSAAPQHLSKHTYCTHTQVTLIPRTSHANTQTRTNTHTLSGWY